MKTIYTFGNGKAEGRADMRDLLGGKGANLAEMNLIGVPVPPGFTITTDVCRHYNKAGREAVVQDGGRTPAYIESVAENARLRGEELCIGLHVGIVGIGGCGGIDQRAGGVISQ